MVWCGSSNIRLSVSAHAISQAILMKLKLKAYQTLEQYRSGAATSLRGSLSSLLPEVGGDDELAMFGGQTRVLVSKILSRQNRRKVQSSPVSAADTSQSTASTPPASDDSHSPSSESIPEVHPTLVEFLRMLPPSSMSLATADARDTATVFHNQGDVNSLPSMFEFMSPSSVPPIFSSPATQTPDSIPGLSFQSPYTLPNPIDTTSIKIDNDINELGLFLSGDSGMDERWKSFMRDSGIWDGAQNYDLMMNL